VEICHSFTRRKIFASGGDLEEEHLLPDFRLPITDLFKDWDWD
jgi:hypothetical protein